jgi:hypothetical protein
VITQRRWLATVLRWLGMRNVIHYRVTPGFVTIDHPLSEADVERFRADFERRRHRMPR